ncbi:MAG: flagellar basal body-associated FliL family protein [Rhodospirillales bacterium]|nr:flagellar basal body-associated FliL family protein [Rhodospirillales bacterium]
MTDTAAASEDDEGEGEGVAEEGEKKGLSGKKIVLFFVLPVVLVLGTAAGVYFSGLADGLLGKTAEDKVAVEKAKQQELRAKAVFFDLPELLVNLNSSGRRTNFLKISISLELPGEADVSQLQLLLPRIIDSFQVYLRELRVTDLKGSAGMYRLREDLLRRVNEAASPVKINDVLFKEMLIQ